MYCPYAIEANGSVITARSVLHDCYVRVQTIRTTRNIAELDLFRVKKTADKMECGIDVATIERGIILLKDSKY